MSWRDELQKVETKLRKWKAGKGPELTRAERRQYRKLVSKNAASNGRSVPWKSRGNVKSAPGEGEQRIDTVKDARLEDHLQEQQAVAEELERQREAGDYVRAPGLGDGVFAPDVDLDELCGPKPLRPRIFLAPEPEETLEDVLKDVQRILNSNEEVFANSSKAVAS